MKGQIIMKKLVTDGTETFSNYYWNNNGCIVNKKSGFIYQKPNNKMKMLKLRDDQGNIKYRSFSKLYKFSFSKKFLPRNYSQYIDVFGWEDNYCFDPHDPMKVFSKKKMEFKAVTVTQKNYPFIRVGKNKSLYLYRMVWEAYHQQFIPEGYQLHHSDKDHFNFDLEKLQLLTEKEHQELHIKQRAEKKKQKQEIKND